MIADLAAIVGIMIAACVVLVLLLVIVAEYFRCPKCRYWHDSEEDQRGCDGSEDCGAHGVTRPTAQSAILNPPSSPK